MKKNIYIWLIVISITFNCGCDPKQNDYKSETKTSEKKTTVSNGKFEQINDVIQKMTAQRFFEKSGITKAFPFPNSDGGGLMLEGIAADKGHIRVSYMCLHGLFRSYFSEPIQIKFRYGFEDNDDIIEFEMDISNASFKKGFDHKESDKFWKQLAD
ncbi:MAG: hypothetical protein JEZ07_16840 [Phycisphaerae bacterium]|nr:hypothetical protein [Phycisphaerae bacterium]